MRTTLPLVALLLGVTASAALPEFPHECGSGPVTVKMALSGCCAAPQPTPRVERVAGDLYATVPNLTTVNTVCMPCEPYEERWTDWPECGGTRIPFVETDIK